MSIPTSNVLWGEEFLYFRQVPLLCRLQKGRVALKEVRNVFVLAEVDGKHGVTISGIPKKALGMSFDMLINVEISLFSRIGSMLE